MEAFWFLAYLREKPKFKITKCFINLKGKSFRGEYEKVVVKI
jgi:hypothetical protein